MNRQPRFFLVKLAQTYYNSFFFFFLLVLAFAIPTSRLLMSMSQIGLALLWILDARYREKLQGFFHNRIALILSSLFLLHLIGMLYTSDFDAAVKDLRIKLPLLLLPFFFSGAKTFSRQKALWILLAFVAGVFYASAFVSIENWFSQQDIQTILSDRFIKHMRFSLNINMAIYSLVLIAIYERKKWPDRIFISVIVLWLFIFMLKMGAMTAYVLFVLLLLYLAVSILMRSRGKQLVLGWMSLGLVLIVSGYFAFAFLRPILIKSELKEISSLEQKTAQGNDYNQISAELTENGKPIYVYICEKELEPEWAKRSRLPYS
ncbi:MAG: hypothetical protein JW857_06905, partial [Bacteroidales bacterium]|nr:hypothetical protein [Bacteroidales bacterium]